MRFEGSWLWRATCWRGFVLRFHYNQASWGGQEGGGERLLYFSAFPSSAVPCFSHLCGHSCYVLPLYPRPPLWVFTLSLSLFPIQSVTPSLSFSTVIFTLANSFLDICLIWNWPSDWEGITLNLLYTFFSICQPTPAEDSVVLILFSQCLCRCQPCWQWACLTGEIKTSVSPLPKAPLYYVKNCW